MKCLSLKQKGITLSQTFAVTVQVYCDLSVILLVAAVCSDKKNLPGYINYVRKLRLR